MAHVTANDCAALAVLDSGAYKTILDVGMAKMLGLRVRESVGGDCGTYSVPGTDASNCYAGVVEDEVIIQLAPGVVYGIQGLKLLRHPTPMFLVGSDILSGGRTQDQWNYAGVTLRTDAVGTVRGRINFHRGEEDASEALVNVPNASGSHAAGTRSIGLIAPPTAGGQCLRRGWA